jgi:2-keto-4-pentenoate hydratase/2-oxohepta-3-ene-1,7-dioic acid hydratase in catechol pathway
MRLVQFSLKTAGRMPEATIRMGALMDEGRAILDLPAMLDAAHSPGGMPAHTSTQWWNLDGAVGPKLRSCVEAALAADAGTIADWTAAGKIIKTKDARLHAPVPRPGKLIAIGLNYRDHAIESKMPIPTSPIVFSKSSMLVGKNPRGSMLAIRLIGVPAGISTGSTPWPTRRYVT